MATANSKIILASVKHAARNVYAWPGGYPIVVVMADGECLCCKCARTEYRAIARATRDPYGNRDWRALGTELHMEGAPIICAHCSAEIESAYGE